MMLQLLPKSDFSLVAGAGTVVDIFDSHPLAGSLSLAKLPAVQVTAVHPLATAVVQAVHEPSVIVAHPASQPLAKMPSLLKKFGLHVTAVQSSALIDVHAVHVPSAMV